MDINELKKIETEGLQEIEEVTSLEKIPELRSKLTGKKSPLSSAFRFLKDLLAEQRQAFGENINKIKELFLARIEEKAKALEEKDIEARLQSEKIDISLPARGNSRGARHPFYSIVDDVTDFFIGLGYVVAEGPEVETDHYNFELLNIPKDHPSRDMQDTFYIDKNHLMRSHTSPVQAHVMQAAGGRGPIKVICPGKTFRRDDDLTHSHQFGQIEGLVIGEDVHMGQLLKTLTITLKHIFGEKREVRFRPSFFPFTEPSVEVDISCANCNGKGCSLCKGTGYIEVLGAGMVHPNVLRMSGFDDKKYQGFAFGIGIDRLAFLKYGIDDIHRFYRNDVDFIKQFTKE